MKNNIDELDSLFQKGYSLYRERNYKSAFKFFEKSIKKHGEHYLKTYYKGQAISSQGKLTESIPYFTESIKQKQNFVEAFFTLATVYQNLGKIEEALEVYKNALDIELSDGERVKISQIRTKLLDRLKKRKNSQREITRRKTVRRKEPLPRERKESPFPPLFGMALVLHTAKKYDSDNSKDGQNITNLLGKFRIDEYVRLQIDYMSMYYAITGQIKLKKTIDEIIELSVKLMHFSINDPLAFDIFNKALGYVNKSKYGKSIVLLREAIIFSPKNPLYALELYKSYMKTQKFRRAIKIEEKIEQELKHLLSLEDAKKEFSIIEPQLEKKWASYNNIIDNYKNVFNSEQRVLPLLSLLTSEIINHLKGEENKLKVRGLNNAIDDCLHCFELLSVVASLVFFQIRFQLGDKDLKLKIKQIILGILGWEPEPLHPIQTPNFLSPRLRKKAWLTTLGMDVLSFRMMDSIQEAKYVHIDGDVGNDNPKTHVWYSKDTADQMSIGRQHANHDTSNRDKIEEHIKAQFGEPLIILHDKGEASVHIDIFVYPPTKERPFGLMITSGMSERPMDAPPDAWKTWPIDFNKAPEEMREVLSCKYAELLVKLPTDWPLPKPGGQLKNDEFFWPIEELHYLIRYVHREHEWLWDGHTMRSSSLTFAPNTKLAGWVFIYPPHLPPTFGMLKINSSKVICFLQIVPAYMEEIQYAMQNGTKKLLDKFREENIPDFIDIRRKNLCQ